VSFTKIFLVVAEIGLPVLTYPGIPYTHIVHRRLWINVHKIFHTCQAPQSLFMI